MSIFNKIKRWLPFVFNIRHLSNNDYVSKGIDNAFKMIEIRERLERIDRESGNREGKL